MGDKEAEFLRKLKAAFKVEAMEHLRAISSGILELEKKPGPPAQRTIFENILREAHSLKGAARVVNVLDIESVCQCLESTLSLLKRGELGQSSELFDLIHRALDAIGSVVLAPDDKEDASYREQILGIIAELSQLVGIEGGQILTKGGEELPPPEAVVHAASDQAEKEPEPSRVERVSALTGSTQAGKLATEKSAMPDTLRISTKKLDSLFLQAEEMIALKLISQQRSSDLDDLHNMFRLWHKEWSKLSVELRPLRHVLEGANPKGDGTQMAVLSSRLLEFLDWNYSHLKLAEKKLLSLKSSADHDLRYSAALTDGMLDESKKLLMMPCSTLLEIFPKLVRDLSRDQAKDVELAVSGMEVQIDKRILEEMKDPLIHLLRNCIDHGIEKPQERNQKGKPPQGKVLISVLPVEGSMIEILVFDDGAGIDLAKVKEAAVKSGVVSNEELDKLNEQESLMLIFQSSVSTSRIITEISGRGLGLAIVREKVEKLGGRILLESTEGAGTKFRLILPVTLATSRGIFVDTCGKSFIVPTANIERVARIKQEEIKTVENRETILLDGKAVSFVWLADLLELKRRERQKDVDAFIEVLVLSSADRRIACGVDQISNEQEVIVKGLGKPLLRVRNVAGATISGSGKVVLILNVADLLKSATRVTTVLARAALPAKEGVEQKSVLVVEDSFTARMLIKNVLEMAGYQVTTAVDGIDGWTILKTGTFDLVVSDIEMPRMTGFDLTAKIRSDKKLGEMPVVLVTALSSREDRERGIEVGANAYIVKSTFDQSNLLEVIERLV